MSLRTTSPSPNPTPNQPAAGATPSPTQAAPGTPVRYAALDLLRGIAIIGTLGTNIWIFTNPAGLIGYLDGSISPHTPPGWAVLEDVLQQLAQGKFLGLLTIMFGIGLEIQRRSAVRTGRRWPGRYPWRAGLLLLDGVVNFVLVAEFDVLMGYALTGIVVAYLLATSERAQRRWLVIAASVHVGMLAVVAIGVALLPAGRSASPLSPNPYAEGSWWDLVAFRLDNAALFRAEPVFIGALSVAMFLAGSQLIRHGVLDAGGGRLRRRLMIIGTLALVADLVVGLTGGDAGMLVGRYGTAPLVALGLLSVVTEVVLRWPTAGFVRRRLTDIGTMALSCYILQNLIAATVCYGWGLGLADRMTPTQRVPGTMIIFVLVVVVVSLFAALWRRRFDRGPVELAWRWSFDRLDAAIPHRP